MSKIIGVTGRKPKEIDGVPADVRRRLSLIIKEEGDRIRKETDQESAHIVTRAREEYRQRLTSVLAEEREKIRKRARQESAGIIAESKELAVRIAREAEETARKQAEESRQQEASSVRCPR